MKILMVNKFLYPNGGSETYIFKLGDYLRSIGHEVQYFGMEHEGRIVGNRVNSYTKNMDFHGGSILSKLVYPVKTIYSSEARKKIRMVLDDFQPDVCHLNNFNYQLTPSIILEIKKWRDQTGHPCKIVYTAHDSQLACPNHMMKNPNTNMLCEKCLGGHFLNCAKGRCIHGSLAKSVIGSMEAIFWKWMDIYRQLDTIICPSYFMKSKLDSNPVLAEKTVVIRNFLDSVEQKTVDKKDYVLYFGRYSEEKGIGTLVEVAKQLPNIPFVVVGSGPLEDLWKEAPNIRNMGFQNGEALETLIREARFTVCPSECYENCPFSVMESLMYGTPVLGADIGGIPELIRVGKTGELFESGSEEQLKSRIQNLWTNADIVAQYSKNCASVPFDAVQQYVQKLMLIYESRQEENI